MVRLVRNCFFVSYNFMKMELDDCIRYLDENFAKIPTNKEVLDIQRAIEDAVSALLENIASRDERFESTLEPSGSFYDGTKIRQADEFDFMVNLPKLARLCDIIYREKGKPHALVCVLSQDEAKEEVSEFWSEFFEEVSAPESWRDQCSRDLPISSPIFCLDGSNLKQKFYSLLRESIKCVSWPTDLKFLTSTGATFDKLGLQGATQAAASEKFDFLWKDNLKVSVDLALALEVKVWPALVGLFESCVGKEHPGYFLKNNIKSSGCHVVPKLGPIWRIAWTRAETTLLKHICSQNSDAAVSYRVAKLINETRFVEAIACSNIRIPFSLCESFSIKHLLMSMWMSHSSSSSGFSKGCSEILLELLSSLLSGFKSGNCQQIFMPGYSTIKEGPMLQPCALALEKCINALETLHGVERSQVPKKCEEFLGQKEIVMFPSPPKKIRNYKIRKIP